MKKMCKQGWSTLTPISTKLAITSHLKSLNVKMTMTYDVGNKGAVPITRLNISGIPKLMLYFTDSD